MSDRRFLRRRHVAEATLADTGLAQWQIVEALSDMVVEDLLADGAAELDGAGGYVAGVLQRELDGQAAAAAAAAAGEDA